MNIRVRSDGKEIHYTTKELQVMDRSELKQIVRELQCSIDEVASKRADYNLKNKEDYNSDEYYKKINNYKKVISILKSQIVYINGLLEKCKKDELQEREHWLFCFYMNAKDSIRKGKFEKLINMTDEHTKYHVDFEIGE